MSFFLDRLDSQSVLCTKQLIDSARHIVILTHMSPDGDAIGSSLGLMLWIRAYKNDYATKVSVIVPNQFPKFLDWLPHVDEIIIYENDISVATHCIKEADLVFYNDLNEPKRLGTLGDLSLTTPCPKILIDHHPCETIPFPISFSFPLFSSTCEIVYCLISQMDALLDHPNLLTLDIATCLYTGLMTDTGNFSYNANDPELFLILSHLLSCGVEKDKIYSRVYSEHSLNRTRLVGYCLYNKMKLFARNKVALIALTKEELYKFRFQVGDGEGIANLPLQIKGVFYSCFMREDKIGIYDIPPSVDITTKIKISFRSRGNHPVNMMAKELFSGGGHLNAAGGEYYGLLEDAINLFTHNIPKYLL